MTAKQHFLKSLQRFSLALIFFPLLQACTVGKNYTRPALPLPDSFRFATQGDTISIAERPWQIFYQDPILQQLIDSALLKNADMQTALLSIEAAGRVLRQAGLNQLPSVNAQVNVSSVRSSDNSLNGLNANQYLGTRHIEDYTTGINLSWEADIWGRIRRQKEAARADYLQTIEARKAIQTQLIADVARAYYNLLTLDAQFAIAQRNASLNDSTLQIIKLQYDAGQVTALAVEQADAQKQTALLLIPQLQQDMATQENALRVLSGELPAMVMRNHFSESSEVPDSLSSGLPAHIVSLRPDVRADELSLRAANARVGVAQASLYPTLVISASGGVNSFKSSNWFNIPASLFGQAAGSITQPLFQRGQLKTQYELAKIEREQWVIRFRQSVINAVGEISDALVKTDKLRERRKIALARADTLRNAVANADLLFRNGMATYLEVITAQANVLQSEIDAADLRRQHFFAMIDLYRSLGGGWK